MTAPMTDLEELYARLVLEDQDDGGVIVAEKEVQQTKTTYVLVGRFLTDRTINFNAMQNVLASLWRPREGMEVHDIGGHRYSFVFYHPFDLQKVLEGGPWAFENNLLIYHKLKDDEDPHLVKLHKFDMWVQIYDLPRGFVSENILSNIGKFIGEFIKADPTNITGGWSMYKRIRVTMNLEKPLRRKMKIKREGGDWNWVNFKYERLGTFCFVCGIVGHSERDCGIVYANHDKDIPRAYGVELRAPNKNTRNQNMGAKWLRNGVDGGQAWGEEKGKQERSTTVHGEDGRDERIMEEDANLNENSGETGGIRIVSRDQGGILKINSFADQTEDIAGEITRGKETIVVDPKRRRLDSIDNMESDEETVLHGLNPINIPKNLREAGPVIQARLDQ